MLYFTTSWDDGSVQDLKVCELLNKYDIKGTFYIPREFSYRGDKFSEYKHRLTDQEIKKIASTQEIGSHSLTHRPLIGLTEEEIKKEIRGSRDYLENIIGHQVKMFCPPKGIFNESIIYLLEKSGYTGARGTRKFCYKLSQNDSFNLGTTIICNPFPFRKKDSDRMYWRRLFDPLKGYGTKLLFFPTIYLNLFSWPSFAKAFFDHTLQNGNYFHLYGHSWELEKYKMWDALENFLKYVKGFSNINYLTNSQVIEILKHEDTHNYR